MSANFDSILAQLNTKLDRQKKALKATEEHIAAIEALKKIETTSTSKK